jgi:uncharacterized protein involved in response to NO
MNNALTALFSWQFLLFCLMVATIMYLIRVAVEYIFSKAVNSRLWNDLFLPILPPVIGAIIGYFASAYAYPEGLNSVSGRVAFGMVAGLLSSLVYRVMKAFLKSQLQTFIQQGGSEITTNSGGTTTVTATSTTTSADASTTSATTIVVPAATVLQTPGQIEKNSQ